VVCWDVRERTAVAATPATEGEPVRRPQGRIAWSPVAHYPTSTVRHGTATDPAGLDADTIATRSPNTDLKINFYVGKMLRRALLILLRDLPLERESGRLPA
jgi:hypothetical protein